MKRYKLFVAVAVCVIAMGVFASAALAGEVVIKGKGEMWAKGVGTIHAVGKGKVEFTCRGAGVVRIRHIDEVKYKIKGVGRKKKVGNTLYIYGLKGSVRVRGEKINVKFHGGRVRFHAVGKGKVYLKGKGKYWFRNGKRRNWPKDGGNVPYNGKVEENTTAEKVKD